jgi:replicative DNA helicase
MSSGGKGLSHVPSEAELRAKARRLQMEHGLNFLIIDYLQLMSSGGKGFNQTNRVQEISEISRALKGLARELKIPILALSQLSRAVELRPSKVPQLSDLRESGAIEQDADVVLMLYRKSYYLERSEPLVGTPEYIKWLDEMETWANKIDIQVEKQRSGPVGTVRCFADMASNVISNLSEPKPSPAPSSEVVEFFA